MAWCRPTTSHYLSNVEYVLCSHMASQGHSELTHQGPALSLVKHVYHYSDVVMDVIVAKMTGVSIGCSTVCSGADQRKRQSTGPCEGNSPVSGEFPHKGRVTQKMFLFDDVIMTWAKSVITDSCNSYATTRLSNRDWNTSRNINIADFDQCYMHNDHANTSWNTWDSVLSLAHPPSPHTPPTPLVPHICVGESGQHWFR